MRGTAASGTETAHGAPGCQRNVSFKPAGVGGRAGGPAEQTFGTLVGLELRPRKLREAAVLWERLTAAAGVDARDAVWNHPDLMPSAADLDEPAGFVDRIIGGDVGGIDFDALIAEIEKDAEGGPGDG